MACSPLFSTYSSNVRSPGSRGPGPYAERFVGTLRRECLDWILILGRRHLEAVVRDYLVHYNTRRPHRGVDLRSPCVKPVEPRSIPDALPRRVRHQDRLGGLLHEYTMAA